MTQPIFKSKSLQTQFDRNGFVKVRLLNEGQANKLLELFNNTKQLHATVDALHHTTTDTANTGLIYQVDSCIKSVFVPELNKIMEAYNPLVGCFHVKEAGSGSETGVHQDPTFVEEPQYCSANVWVALQDTNKENGNLYFIRGSNHAVHSLRTVPDSPNYYASFHQSLPAMAEHVPLKKGEAVIFNNATIHGATENLSAQIRLAATLLVCSENAEWLLHYKEKNAAQNQIEQYHLDLETFATMPKNGRPDKKAFKQYIAGTFRELTKEEFLKRVNATEARTGNFLQKFRNIFTTGSVV